VHRPSLNLLSSTVVPVAVAKFNSSIQYRTKALAPSALRLAVAAGSAGVGSAAIEGGAVGVGGRVHGRGG
jgi:hypothetical protein